MTRMTGPDCAVMCNLINTHTHTHTRTPDGNGDDDNGNENGIGEGGREAKKRKKRRIVVDAMRETGETRVESEKKCRKGRVG